MKKIFERVTDLSARRKLEAMQADLEKQKAIMDYIAMMADVEIPEDEGDHNDSGM